MRKLRDEIQARCRDEIGTLEKDAPEAVALLYPSPYHVAMSSLGYQTIYRSVNAVSGRAAHRAFLPDDVEVWRASRVPLVTYEALRPVSHYPVVAVSVAYEAELAGMIQALELAGIPPLSDDRDERHPFILAGGPLTFSNPLPLAPFVDAVLMGEADQSVHTVLATVFDADSKEGALRSLRAHPHVFVPSLGGDVLPPIDKADDAELPAFSQVITPHTELRNMFLIEPERGCHRGCTYCVMRRSTNDGMRLVEVDKVLSIVPEHAERVGLVGAATTDHPQIAQLVNALADSGREVGLSSLRADRLTDELVAALRRGGHRVLTTASDGASQRMRDLIQRRTSEQQLRNAARLARKHGMKRLKLYVMVGLPAETDNDIGTELIGTPSEVLHHEAAEPAGASADVFSYTSEPSEIMYGDGGQVVLAQEGEEIPVFPTASPGAADRVELDALDAYTPLFTLNDQIPLLYGDSSLTTETVHGELPAFYFSVSNETAANIPEDWAPLDLRRGSTIFEVSLEPVGAASYVWAPPSAFLSAAELGIGDEEDVDAFAFDRHKGYVLFSTRELPGPVREPILFRNLGVSAEGIIVEPTGLCSADGLPWAEKIGGPFLEGGGVDALCALDPLREAFCPEPSKQGTSAMGSAFHEGDPAGQPGGWEEHVFPCVDKERGYLWQTRMGLASVLGKTGNPAGSLKAFAETRPGGPGIRFVLRDAPEVDTTFLLTSNDDFFYGWPTTEAHLLDVPIGWWSDEWSLTWTPGSTLQQMTIDYPIGPGVPVEVFFQTIGCVNGEVVYGSEILKMTIAVTK